MTFTTIRLGAWLRYYPNTSHEKNSEGAALRYPRAQPVVFVGLFCALCLLVSTGAGAQDRSNVRTLDCGSRFFQSLMTAPLQDVRQDLAATLYTLNQFEYVMGDPNRGGCLGRAEARYGPLPLLLSYLENRWISQSLGETLEPVATALDAARQEMRRQENIDSPENDEALEARRALALQRSLTMEVHDPNPAADDVEIHLRNTSSWTIQLHPYRAGASGWGLRVWFEPLPEGAPVKFDCLDSGPHLLASGAEVSLTCRRFVISTPGGSGDSQPAPRGNGQWTLHRGTKLGWLTQISAMDIGVDSPQARAKASSLVDRSTCEDRGSCALEKEIRHRGENDLPLIIVLSVVGVLALALLFPRFSVYVLGPLVLALAAILVIFGHKLFVPFHSDGSPAGLLVPAMAWVALIVCCGIGLTLILTGRARMRRVRARD